MAEKTVNYTAEQTQAIIAAYTDGTSVESIAENFGKTTRSIIAKLTREGVYKKKEYLTKTGEKAEKKDQTADAIAQIVGLTESETESLTKANKSALKKILDKLK